MEPYNLPYNIKQLRHKKGWTQEDVAKQMNISIPAYSKLETGITDINLSRLYQIAELYDITVVELLTNTPANTEELNLLKEKLIERDEQVIQLLKQVVGFYENSKK